MADPKLIYCGRFEHILDEKGRLMLPSALRDETRKSSAPDRLFLGYYPGTRHLSLYPEERWQALAESWGDERRFPSTKLMMEAKRLFFANLEPLAIDKAGRILIPASYRERAGIVREATVVGVFEKMEIWSPTALAEGEAKAAEMLEAAMAAEAAAGAGAEDGPRLPQW
jgi:MraZ protein